MNNENLMFFQNQLGFGGDMSPCTVTPQSADSYMISNIQKNAKNYIHKKNKDKQV